MAILGAQELRDGADYYRTLRSDGDDLHLKAALLELANEFKKERQEQS
jgi:hypothetical protein